MRNRIWTCFANRTVSTISLQKRCNIVGNCFCVFHYQNFHRYVVCQKIKKLFVFVMFYVGSFRVLLWITKLVHQCSLLATSIVRSSWLASAATRDNHNHRQLSFCLLISACQNGCRIWESWSSDIPIPVSVIVMLSWVSSTEMFHHSGVYLYAFVHIL